MPIVQFHLIDCRHSDEAVGALLRDASAAYVDIFYPDMVPRPIERVRAFATFSAPQHWATAGVLGSEGGADAPYFTCLALQGRPQEQLDALLSAFTDLVAHHLGCAKMNIRGQIIEIDPNHWSIGGSTANVVRQGEASMRSRGNQDAGHRDAKP